MGYLDRLLPNPSQPIGAGTSNSKKRSLPFKAPSRVESGTQAPSATSRGMAKSAAKQSTSRTTTSRPSAGKPKTGDFTSAAARAAVVLSSDAEGDDLDETPPPTPPGKRRKRASTREAVESESGEEERPAQDSASDASAEPVQPTSTRRAGDQAAPIPQKLLTRLLYEGFEDKSMKIGKEAMDVAGKYIDTFVREALARALHERRVADDTLGKGTGDEFLQVEDLEKLAPQLLLDF